MTRDTLSYPNEIAFYIIACIKISTHTHTDMSKSHYANVVKHAEATAAPLAAVRHLCKWSEY